MMADVEAEHAEAGHGDWHCDNFYTHEAWLVPCKTWFSLRQSWWEEFFSVKAAWTRSSGVLFQYSGFRSFSANGTQVILHHVAFFSLEFLNLNLTIFWGISHFEKLTALKSSWYDGNEVMIRWMSNSCYMEPCRSLVTSRFNVSQVSRPFKDFQLLLDLSLSFLVVFPTFLCLNLSVEAPEHLILLLLLKTEMASWSRKVPDSQTTDRQLAVSIDHDYHGVSRSVIARSWGFRVKKHRSESPATSLGCASGSERAFYGQGCYFAELAQHLGVEIILFDEFESKSTKYMQHEMWNPKTPLWLSMSCMSWVWECVETRNLNPVQQLDSQRYSHLYSYAANGNHQLLLADVLCGNVPWGDQMFEVFMFTSAFRSSHFFSSTIWQSLISGVWDGRRATRPVKQYKAVRSGEVCPVWARYASVSRHSKLATELPNRTRTLKGWIELESGAIVLGCAAIVTRPKTASECAFERLLLNFGSDYSYFHS